MMHKTSKTQWKLYFSVLLLLSFSFLIFINNNNKTIEEKMCTSSVAKNLLLSQSVEEIIRKALSKSDSKAPIFHGLLQLSSPIISQNMEKHISFEKLLRANKSKNGAYYCSAIIVLDYGSKHIYKYYVEYIVREKKIQKNKYIQVELLSLTDYF